MAGCDVVTVQTSLTPRCTWRPGFHPRKPRRLLTSGQKHPQTLQQLVQLQAQPSRTRRLRTRSASLSNQPHPRCQRPQGLPARHRQSLHRPGWKARFRCAGQRLSRPVLGTHPTAPPKLPQGPRARANPHQSALPPARARARRPAHQLRPLRIPPRPTSFPTCSVLPRGLRSMVRPGKMLSPRPANCRSGCPSLPGRHPLLHRPPLHRWPRLPVPLNRPGLPWRKCPAQRLRTPGQLPPLSQWRANRPQHLRLRMPLSVMQTRGRPSRYWLNQNLSSRHAARPTGRPLPCAHR